MAQEVGHVDEGHVLADEQAGEGVPLPVSYTHLDMGVPIKASCSRGQSKETL